MRRAASSGQTGYYHESQVPDYLLKLDWSTHCSPSYQQPCLYLSPRVPPSPPLFSSSHPHTMGQSPRAFVPWEGGQHEQRRGMAPIRECLGASVCCQQHVSHSWCDLLTRGVQQMVSGIWPCPLWLVGPATVCWEKKNRRGTGGAQPKQNQDFPTVIRAGLTEAEDTLQFSWK